MSRVGNLAIQIPEGVTASTRGDLVKVAGPLGELEVKYRPEIEVKVLDNQIIVKRKNETGLSKSLHGLTRSLIANMVLGVSKGWEKKLELVGVGFRASTDDSKLILSVGYSHPVKVIADQGIKFAVLDNTKITVTGIDKGLVGQVAARIRAVRPPEPYQGKGIRYLGEYVRRKAGKAAKVGAQAK